MIEDPSAASRAEPIQSDPTGARRLVAAGLAITLVIAVFGLIARQQMFTWGLVFPGPVNVFFRLYAFHEALPLILLLGWTLVALLIFGRRAQIAGGETRLERLGPPSRRATAVLAGA